MSEIKTPASVDQVRDFVGWLFMTKLTGSCDRDGQVSNFLGSSGVHELKPLDDFYEGVPPSTEPFKLVYDLLMKADDQTLRALYYFAVGFARWQPTEVDLYFLGHAHAEPPDDLI